MYHHPSCEECREGRRSIDVNHTSQLESFICSGSGSGSGSVSGFRFRFRIPDFLVFHTPRTVGYWNKSIKRKMKRKSSGSHPWTVKFKWNLRVEVFDCLKVATFTEGDAATHKETRAIHEIHFTNGDKLKTLFLTLGNKYKRTFNFEDFFIRTEKDQSISHLIDNKDHPASMKYAKNSEVLTFRARYGHFNRHGVPQHCLV